jgi:hypothetical protein
MDADRLLQDFDLVEDFNRMGRHMRFEVKIAAGILPLVLAACGESEEQVATVPPAAGDELVEYSRNITDAANRRQDAGLYEYFCQNTFNAPCPADIETQLAPHRVAGGISRVHLADAFVRLKAATELGDPGAIIPDEAYVAAAYQVILGRDADPTGATDHLNYIRSSGQRQGSVQAMLQSEEFRSR